MDDNWEGEKNNSNNAISTDKHYNIKNLKKCNDIKLICWRWDCLKKHDHT